MPPEKQIQSSDSSYDFILNAGEPPKESLWNQINKKRLFIFLALLLIVIIVCSIVLSIISSKNNEAQRARLLTVAQIQTEVIRTTELGKDNIQDEELKVRTENINKTLSTALENSKQMISERNGTIEDTQLNAEQDKNTEDLLTKAQTYGNYDKTFDKILNTKLTAYQQALLNAEKSASKAEKGQLEANYKEADAMLGLVDHL